MREIGKWEATFSLIAYIFVFLIIGTVTTVQIPGGWPIWFVVGPLAGLLLVAIWGVWRW